MNNKAENRRKWHKTSIYSSNNYTRNCTWYNNI